MQIAEVNPLGPAIAAGTKGIYLCNLTSDFCNFENDSRRPASQRATIEATAAVLSLAFRDAVHGADLRGIQRAKVLIQAFSALALARRVRHLGIVHIHAHMAHVPTTIAMYAARQLGIGFSFTGHANDLFPSRS